jgi:hypothetical protein
LFGLLAVRVAAADPSPSPAPVRAPDPEAVPGEAATVPVPSPTPQPDPSTTSPPPVRGPSPRLGFGIAPAATADSKSATEQRHVAAEVCASHDPACDWVATFSSLEKRSIARTLIRRGLEIEAQPWGKLIDEVVVENEDVFAEDNWLQFFNAFHYTTREGRVRGELTIQSGEVWDQDRVEESARRLHDPLYTSVVALLPVKSRTPGAVKLLVITRDIWSLRLNTQYTYQQGSLTNLAFSLSENNFLGSRDVVAASIAMDPGAIAIGPYFIEKNLLGKHLNLTIKFDEIITRQAGLAYDPATNTFKPIAGDPVGVQDGNSIHSEGSSASIALSKPLWSLASEWGWGTSFSYKNSVARSFTGSDPRASVGNPYELYTDPESGLPYEFRLKTWSVSANGVRQWGAKYKQQVSAGYTVSSQKSSLLDTPTFTNAEGSVAAQFEDDVFPRSEVISQPHVSWSLFQPRYATVRNVSTYELAEDINLGPTASATLAQGLSALGGDTNFTRPTLGLGWIFPWAADGFIHPSASGTMRFQSSAPHGWSSIDNTATAQLRVASPTFEWFRVLAQAEVATQWHNTQNSFYAIGSDSGLRGYNVNEFRSARSDSSRRATGQLEFRTVPVPWSVFRVGAVGFYEVGGVAESLQRMSLHSDVGFGVRLLIPQTSRELFRFDLALPLQDAVGNPAFHPHFIAGFASYF